LGQADQPRAEFEIFEAKRILTFKFGNMDAFAYPFGGHGSYSDATSELVKRAGFRLAFLTHSDFADREDDHFRLPRIALPNRPMALAEFRARVGGGGIVLAKVRDYVSGRMLKLKLEANSDAASQV
jgi:hypothetical protein